LYARDYPIQFNSLRDTYLNLQWELLGASYGPKDVTDTTQALMTNFPALLKGCNLTYGDPWGGVRKSFVVVYYSRGRVFTLHTEEDQPMVVPYQKGAEFVIQDSIPVVATYLGKLPVFDTKERFLVLGATYGRKIITAELQKMLTRRSKQDLVSVKFNSSTFGDSWPQWAKTATVCYFTRGQIRFVVVRENATYVFS